jgi:hypothetical protein
MIIGKRIFKHELYFDVTLEWPKACGLFICGYIQRSRVDFHDTFSPIVKLATFTVLSLALSYDLYIYLLDVKKIVHASFWRQCIVSNLLFCWFCSSGLCMLSQKSLYGLSKHRRLGISTLPLTYNLLDFKKPNPTHPYFLPSWLYYFVSTSICGWYRLDNVIIGLASTNCELPLDVLFHGGFWAFTTFSTGSP